MAKIVLLCLAAVPPGQISAQTTATSMQPRLYDPRVRFMHTQRYIYRWRLEKKDPTVPVSDVVRPIVFRISEDVPAGFVPQIKASIEKWNPVLEAVGFRHAIVVRLPTDTAAASDREVVLSWDTVSGEGLGGSASPNIDTATGEILSATITIAGQSLDREARNLLMRGELDPRTRLPLPDSINSLLLDDVVLHEAGHALGLDHNFKGSGIYPTDSLRSPSFLRRMGASSSVMAYASGNYVAQPGDGVTFMDRRARIGLYDRWSIAWGYRPIPGATTPEAERPVLEQWRSVQDTTPYLQSTFEHDATDPTDQPFTGGDNPVKSSEYGLRNLTRLVAALDPNRDTMPEVQPKPYFIGVSWSRRMKIAASVVGGVTTHLPYLANAVPVLPVDSARQVEAMRFVLEHVMYGRDSLVAQYVLTKDDPHRSSAIVLFDSVAHGWYAEQWQKFQNGLLQQLVQSLQEASLARAPGTRTALCQELKPLETQLVAAKSEPGIRGSHATALETVVAALFQPGAVCSH